VSISSRRYASHVALVSSIHEPSNCLEEERCDTWMEYDGGIDSKFSIDGSVVEYKGRLVGFYNIEGVEHDVTLDLGLSWDEGVDPIQVVLEFRDFWGA
jgi:hypothetical protein